MPFMGISEGILLLAIIAGYTVILRARKEVKFLKATGFVIGIVTIFLSIILLFESLMGDYQFYKAFLTQTGGYAGIIPKQGSQQ